MSEQTKIIYTNKKKNLSRNFCQHFSREIKSAKKIAKYRLKNNIHFLQIYRHGKEVFITYRLASCQNKGIFYTDSNGLEMVMRNRRQREELVSASFYPVTTSIFIQDNQTDLSVLTDRSQGGTSLGDGEVSMTMYY